MNFVNFRAAFHRFHPHCPLPMSFVAQQWRLLRAGVRDARIHSAAFNAWTNIGGHFEATSVKHTTTTN